MPTCISLECYRCTKDTDLHWPRTPYTSHLQRIHGHVFKQNRKWLLTSYTIHIRMTIWTQITTDIQRIYEHVFLRNTGMF